MNLQKSLPWLLVLLLGAAVVFFMQSPKSELVPEVTGKTVVDKITAMGKLELVKIRLNDVMEYKKQQSAAWGWIKYDNKAVVIVVGEAVGCVDLTLLKDSNIVFVGDSLVRVTLPKPEVCYYKVNLSESKVFQVETGWLDDEVKLVDEAYKEAEKRVNKSALDAGILEMTKKNALLVLQPLLEQLTGKKVELVFAK